ncbi:hypothetical protein ACWCYL_33190 [Streptomyces sp. 900105755]
MIVRDAARSLLRDAVPVRPVDEGLHLPSTEAGPEQWLERSALRDRVWEALEQLSPRLRLPLLRHLVWKSLGSRYDPGARIGAAGPFCG